MRSEFIERQGNEIVFKRESYFADVAAHLVLFGLAIGGVVYFLDSGVIYYGWGLLVAAGLVLSAYSHWWDYQIRIVVSDEGIAETHRRGVGGWQYKWSEIGEWNAVLPGDGDREIQFTTTGDFPKTHILPTAIIGKENYRYMKEIFLEHCGKPTKVDSWRLANAPDDE